MSRKRTKKLYVKRLGVMIVTSFLLVGIALPVAAQEDAGSIAEAPGSMAETTSLPEDAPGESDEQVEPPLAEQPEVDDDDPDMLAPESPGQIALGLRSFQSVESAPVTNLEDLKAALADSGLSTVVFGTVPGGSIELDGPLFINRSITFRAESGAVTLTSAPGYRHLLVTGGNIALTFADVTLSGNNHGGGINTNADILTLVDVAIEKCDTTSIADENEGAGIALAAGKTLAMSGGVIQNCTTEISYSSSLSGQLEYRGGAIVAGDGSTVTLSNGTSLLNNVACHAGAIAITNGSLTLGQDVKVIGNYGHKVSSNVMGGAIQVMGGTLTANGATINGNGHTGSNGSMAIVQTVGGAVYIKDSVLSMTDTTVDNNRADQVGIGVYALNSNVSVTGGSLSGNQSLNRNASCAGGGIFLNGGSLEVQGSASAPVKLNNNNVVGSGAAISVCNVDQILLRHVEFVGNSSNSGGGTTSGAVGIIGGQATIEYCTFTDNTVTWRLCRGGGIYFEGMTGDSVIRNSVFNGNKAIQGSAVFWLPTAQQTLTIENTVFTDNTKPDSVPSGISYQNPWGAAIYLGDLALLRLDGVSFSSNGISGKSYSSWDINLADTQVYKAINNSAYKDITYQMLSAAHLLNVKNTTQFSDAHSNAYNGADVQYYSISAPDFTVNYYIDEVAADSLLGSETSVAVASRQLDETDAGVLLGDVDWKQKYKPTGTLSTLVTPTLPFLVSNDAVSLDVVHYIGYSVQYNAAGGSGALPVEKIYTKGQEVTVTSVIPTRGGYQFKGWSDGSATYLANATFTMPSSNISLTALWEAVPTYRVTFDSRGGSNVEALTGVVSGMKITQPTSPTRSGYQFTGWYKDTAGLNKWNFGSDTVSNDITLYSGWSAAAPSSSSDNSNSGSDNSNSGSDNSNSGSDNSNSGNDNSSSSSSIVVLPDRGGTLAPPANTTPPGEGGTTPTIISPEVQAQLDAQAGQNILESLSDGNVPLAGFGFSGGWGLVNFLLSIVGAVLSLLTVIWWAKKRREVLYSAAGEPIVSRKHEMALAMLRSLTIASGLLVGMTFLLLEDLALPVVWFNSNTPIILVLLLLQFGFLLAMVFAKRRRLQTEQRLLEEEDVEIRDWLDEAFDKR